MYDQIDLAGHLWVAVYFLSYYFIVIMMTLNILTALIIDVFTMFTELRSEKLKALDSERLLREKLQEEREEREEKIRQQQLEAEAALMSGQASNSSIHALQHGSDSPLASEFASSSSSASVRRISKGAREGSDSFDSDEDEDEDDDLLVMNVKSLKAVPRSVKIESLLIRAAQNMGDYDPKRKAKSIRSPPTLGKISSVGSSKKPQSIFGFSAAPSRRISGGNRESSLQSGSGRKSSVSPSASLNDDDESSEANEVDIAMIDDEAIEEEAIQAEIENVVVRWSPCLVILIHLFHLVSFD